MNNIIIFHPHQLVWLQWIILVARLLILNGDFLCCRWFCYFVDSFSVHRVNGKTKKKKHNLLPLFLVDILMLDAHMKMIYFYTNCLNFLPLLLSVAITTSATTLFIFLNAILCLHTLISTMNSEVEHSPPYHFLSQKNGLSINFRERGFLPS